MTSTLARNYRSAGLGPRNYIEADREGAPLQGQVPLTYQYYRGTGNETVKYDGSNVIVIDSTLAAGDLTLDFSPMSDFLGRVVQFIAPLKTLNDVNLTFGVGGELFVPPLEPPINSTVLTPDKTPTTSIFTFFERNKAVVLYNPTIFPSNIVPGGPGQVLTTNAMTGVVDWENPGASAPKALAFKWDTANTDLNNNTAQQVQWTIDNANNNTTLTLGNGAAPGLCGQFTVTTAGPYAINASALIIASPDICFRGFIAINNEIWAYKTSTLGLLGQVLEFSLNKTLAVNDIIAIYIGNAQGTVSVLNPAAVDYGCVSILQFVY